MLLFPDSNRQPFVSNCCCLATRPLACTTVDVGQYKGIDLAGRDVVIAIAVIWWKESIKVKIKLIWILLI